MKLAVIPARGGSKRIPRKNVKSFVGKPMIAYAIEAAAASGCFDRIVVSTDDDEIAEAARAAGADVPFRRPAELSDDLTPTVPVIAHAIQACLSEPHASDAVCCIYPGVPLLDPAALAQALALLEQGNAQYIFPVIRFGSPIQRALRRGVDGQVSPFHPEYVNTRTQDLEPAYHDAGQFYWGVAAAWRAGLNIHVNGASIVLPEWRAVDIDTPEDWLRAEALYQVQQALTSAPTGRGAP
ncbi:pseudaminic acid cytidylyltransferase [Polaromonas sp.]|uniref:pseudaminic acid cytidylyltransferase n=1 Tax=Polaromonas sp. TaxID=1869339 RepID=UPI003BACF26F